MVDHLRRLEVDMMIRNRLPLLVAASALVATAAVPAGAGMSTAAPPGAVVAAACCNELQDVDVMSPSYAWAVGSTSNGSTRKSLAMHWNGSVWRTFPTPMIGVESYLNAVVAISPTHAWAVGAFRNAAKETRTLTLRWNGSAWRVVPSPNVNPVTTNPNILSDLAYTPGAMWAVGSGGSGVHGNGSLAMRWNGMAWKIVPVPQTTGGSELTGVSLVSATDAWAVGHSYSGTVRTRILRWNGTAWRAVPSPNAGTGNNYLLGGVAAVTAKDAWAVGSYESGGKWRTLAIRWNGAAWNVVATPNPGTSANNLYGGVSAAAGNSVWAVGGASNGGGYRPLVLRWNGTTWQVSPAPMPIGSSELGGVDAYSSSFALAVGSVQSSPSFARTLRLRWNGTLWRAF